MEVWRSWQISRSAEAARLGSPYKAVSSAAKVSNEESSAGGGRIPVVSHLATNGWNHPKADPSRRAPAYMTLALSSWNLEGCPPNFRRHFVRNGMSSLRFPLNVGASAIFGSSADGFPVGVRLASMLHCDSRVAPCSPRVVHRSPRVTHLSLRVVHVSSRVAHFSRRLSARLSVYARRFMTSLYIARVKGMGWFGSGSPPCPGVDDGVKGCSVKSGRRRSSCIPL